MTDNKKDEIVLQGQEEVLTGDKEKQTDFKESKIYSNMKLKFINPSRRRQYYQTRSRK
jgi:hypothetical protein